MPKHEPTHPIPYEGADRDRLRTVFLAGIRIGRSNWDSYFGEDEDLLDACFDAEMASIIKDGF